MTADEMRTPADGAAWLLAIDTATNTIVVAAGALDGSLISTEGFEGRYRHSQELLPAVVRLVERAGLPIARLAGIVIGTGPGAFTGLRVGIATAKTLAHELGLPIVGVPSSSALLAAVPDAGLVWLPSGPRDRVAIAAGAEPVVVPGTEAGPAAPTGTVELAVDLEGRAGAEALARGHRAVAGLPAALLRLGAARLAAGERDDPERLVPRYASPPRGATSGDAEGSVAWSRDPR